MNHTAPRFHRHCDTCGRDFRATARQTRRCTGCRQVNRHPFWMVWTDSNGVERSNSWGSAEARQRFTSCAGTSITITATGTN